MVIRPLDDCTWCAQSVAADLWSLSLGKWGREWAHSDIDTYGLSFTVLELFGWPPKCFPPVQPRHDDKYRSRSFGFVGRQHLILQSDSDNWQLRKITSMHCYHALVLWRFHLVSLRFDFGLRIAVSVFHLIKRSHLPTISVPLRDRKHKCYCQLSHTIWLRQTDHWQLVLENSIDLLHMGYETLWKQSRLTAYIMWPSWRQHSVVSVLGKKISVSVTLRLRHSISITFNCVKTRNWSWKIKRQCNCKKMQVKTAKKVTTENLENKKDQTNFFSPIRQHFVDYVLFK